MADELGINVSDGTSIVETLRAQHPPRPGDEIRKAYHPEWVRAQQIALREQRDELVAYLYSRIKANDLHAVQDAASDIRELDAKLSLLKEWA